MERHVISPEMILPYPQIKRRQSNRGRKAGTAFKVKKGGEMFDKPSTSDVKVRKPQKSKKKMAKYNSSSSSDIEKISLASDSDNSSPNKLQVNDPNADAECVYCCCGRYSDDTRGLEWIQCIACRQWSHVECSGAECPVFICDFCLQD
ncbi:hypothetical protein ACJJTC_007135 [Scirpophaga incertulas]